MGFVPDVEGAPELGREIVKLLSRFNLSGALTARAIYLQSLSSHLGEHWTKPLERKSPERDEDHQGQQLRNLERPLGLRGRQRVERGHFLK